MFANYITPAKCGCCATSTDLQHFFRINPVMTVTGFRWEAAELPMRPCPFTLLTMWAKHRTFLPQCWKGSSNTRPTERSARLHKKFRDDPNGCPCEIRTHDQSLMRRQLSPAELKDNAVSVLLVSIYLE